MGLVDLLRFVPDIVGHHQATVLEGQPSLYVEIWYGSLLEGQGWVGSIKHWETEHVVWSVEGKEDRGKVILELENALLKQFPWTRPLLYPASSKTALERILADEEFL